MASKNSPLKYSSADLEIEAINRFRSLSPFLPRECRVFRQLEGRSTSLCLDFTNCPQELENPEELPELAMLLALSSHYLGLSYSILLKIGDRVIIQIDLSELV
jgi:hypothetical protein